MVYETVTENTQAKQGRNWCDRWYNFRLNWCIASYFSLYLQIPCSYLIIHAGIQSDLDLLLQDFSHKYSVLLLNVGCLSGWLQWEGMLPEMTRSIVCIIHHIRTFLQIWITFKPVHQIYSGTIILKLLEECWFDPTNK